MTLTRSNLECEPGTSFKVHVYDCVCEESGDEAVCKRGPFSEMEKKDKDGPKGYVCVPGEPFPLKNCNVCFCGKDGYGWCSLELMSGNC